ncbi:putative aquaporin-10 [Bradysia coprophila]|uniref:putative aquaporin-10 n=1 Tax=Bradysia coprophila TaxID=38358 RepID=UPI00187DD2DA|nr:putative aquaporin-10 [Bradysia coprophila]
MEPFVPSLFFYAIVVGFCELCRRGCDKYLKNSGSPTSPKGFLISAIGALQAITCVYENQLVVQHYGLGGFAVTVFLLLNVHRLTNRGCILSPAAVSERYLIGQMGIRDCVGVLVAELLGGALGFKLAGLFWRLGLSEQHFVHYKTFDCMLAYKTPILTVALYEFLAVMAIRIIIGYVTKHKPKYSAYAISLSVSLLLTIGIATVGPVALNPLVAHGRFFGCKGISHYEYALTYWLAPISGWILGWQVDKRTVTAPKRHLKKK